YQIVDTPAHSGRRAAAFTVTSDSSRNGYEARCVLQGALPPEASYGVWFYLSSLARNTDNWNLVHFQGGAPNAWHNLWDVSLNNAADGSLYLRVFDALRGVYRVPNPTVSVPVGEWFHVEFRFKRAKDATGGVALYQNGVLLLELTGVVTDDSDLAQWYVGNLAKGLIPTDSTLYVDDVTIRPPS
ncbi:MAG: heparin lyase I family protein, partial [Deltaproteobacteria bacterium]|nr:heparin lyase I family protein [Deltaproteobacteria bacterium]